MVDTYWSDHCRHTTFSTHIDRVEIWTPGGGRPPTAATCTARAEVYGPEKAAARPQTLMDMATIGAKVLKKRGLLQNLDESEEINACSIHVAADGGRGGAGLAAHVQERDPQPPHRDRALRRRGHLHRRLPSATRCPAGPMCIRPCA